MRGQTYRNGENSVARASGVEVESSQVRRNSSPSLISFLPRLFNTCKLRPPVAHHKRLRFADYNTRIRQLLLELKPYSDREEIF